MATASSVTPPSLVRSSALTSSGPAGIDETVGAPATARVPVKRVLIGAGVVLLLAAAVAIGFTLAEDPFAELPDDPGIIANIAGTLPAEGESALEEPAGIAIRGSRVYVSDSAAGVIRIFDRYGRDKGSIVLPASEAAASRPGPIALADDGRFAVVDSGLGQVVVVKARAAEDAEILFVLGDVEEGTAPIRPVAVAYADGEYYVVGSTEAKVRVYDSDGVPVREVTPDVTPPVEYPGGLLVSNGTILLSDTKSGRVLAFDARTGEMSAEWPDTYTVPRGLTVAGDGFAVADVLGQTAFVVDAEGVRTHVLDRETVADLTLALPESVAWDDAKSRLYVVDSASAVVVVLNVRVQ